jgi:hypothetical protein
VTTREQIFEALFALTDGVQWNIGTEQDPVMQGFVTRSRRIALFSDVPATAQPWIGQAEHRESYTKKTTLPYRNVYSAVWMIYHKAGEAKGSVPAITNNLIIDALFAAIAPKPGDPGFLDRRNTLSGLVHSCFFEGDVLKDPGDIDRQALIVMPIKILVP